eukprot:8770397-Ditylum_brightwellii.AAC.1
MVCIIATIINQKKLGKKRDMMAAAGEEGGEEEDLLDGEIKKKKQGGRGEGVIGDGDHIGVVDDCDHYLPPQEIGPVTTHPTAAMG